jgi:hypothetical protein
VNIDTVEANPELKSLLFPSMSGPAVSRKSIFCPPKKLC